MLFKRNLKDLHQKGGTAAMAAGKAEALIRQLSGVNERDLRKQFRFTRHGEYRIQYCGKYDLGCGYRLAFIRRGSLLALLYLGSHDDCFRWIARNRGRSFKIRNLIQDDPSRNVIPSKGCTHPTFVKEDPLFDEYETNLLSKINESDLRKIFSAFEGL